MIAIDGYKIVQRLKQERETAWYEAVDQRSRTVLLIHQSTEGLSHSTSSDIFYDYKKIENLRSDNLVRIHRCLKIPAANREDVVLVCELNKDTPFRTFQKRVSSDLLHFFDFAIPLAETANLLHQKGVLLKEVNPTTILFGKGTESVRLNTPLVLLAGSMPINRRTGKSLYDIAFVQNVLPYISPEQTGRVNRQVDYRSDFYAFGILFYEWLTGRTPFDSEDPLELIHSHIARQPLPPSKIRIDIPEMLSRVTLKLLAKMPEERYQSAFGLISDLRRCHQEYAHHSSISLFALGNRDAPETLRISRKIFGREEPLERLLSIFEDVRSGSAEIVTISGPPGIGKTRLVEELKVSVSEAGGFFGSGKYDPFHRNTPYIAIIEAYRAILKRILGESSETLAYWKEQLLSRLGRHIRVIMDFISELELIVGAQAPLPDMPPDKAEQRFFKTCQDFMQILAQRENPVIIFLDDLQWIDSASIALIEHVLREPTMNYALFIGVYRDNEVGGAHPLSFMLENIKATGIPMGGIALGPIGVEHVRQTIIASLSKNIAGVQQLAELVHIKTHGNPFFVGQFIQTLYMRNLLYFDFQSGVWRWDDQGIRAQSFTDNVIELMSSELQELSAEARDVLKTAACIGNRFDFPVLEAVSEASPKETAEGLLRAIDAGYIQAKGDSYSLLNRLLSGPTAADEHATTGVMGFGEESYFEFLHDRVHQAVYYLLPVQSRRTLHLKVGQVLLDRVDRSKLQDHVFNIVNQLNHIVDVDIEQRKRAEFSRLFLVAGRKAKEGAAYHLAANYFNTGIALLSNQPWKDDHELSLGLYRGKMECAFLSGSHDEAERLFDFLAERIASALDKADLMNFKMIMLASSGRHKEAVAIGLEGLTLLGHPFSVYSKKYALKARIVALKRRLSRRKVMSLATLPEITGPKERLVMKFLLDISFSAYTLNPEWIVAVAVQIFDLTLKYGNSPAAATGYAIFGAYLCSRFEDIELGCYLGELALDADEKLSHVESSAKIRFYYISSICYYRQPLRSGMAQHRDGLVRAMEVGDLNFAVYHIQSLLIYAFASGLQLDEVDKACDDHFDFISQSMDRGGMNYLHSLKQTIKCLKGETRNQTSLDDGVFSESLHLQNLLQDNIKMVTLRHYLLRLELFYIMGEYDDALKAATQCSKLIRYHAGSIVISEYWFYRCLTLLALCDQVPLQQRRRYRRKIRRFQKRFDVLAEENAANFKHKQLILQGEKAKVDGRFDKALGFFKDAIASAQENGFTNMAAMTYELAAKVALKQGYQPLAAVFLQEANSAYLKWGASAKSKMLLRKHPQFHPEPLQVSGLPASRQLDFATVVSALQTISTEIVLDRLLKKLMRIVVENAGAQRVLFILKQERGLVLKASSSVGGPIRITNQAMPVENREDLLLSGIHFVQHTLESVVIDNAQTHYDYRTDPYVLKYRPKSIFCLPVLRQSELVAMLYLENNIVTGAFTPDRIEILSLIASQAAISIENARLYKNVTQKERDLIDVSEKLRMLSSELLLTEERERRRIAIELHDRIGHALANVKMELGALNEEMGEGGNAERMQRISQFIDQSIEDTQSLTFELSPPVLYDLGLEAAVEWLVDQMQEQYRIAIAFEDDLKPKPLDESTRVLAFQATRELLFNIVKHAHAHHAWVTLKRASSVIRIEISDDGIGMHSSIQGRTTMRKDGGFGLFSIQERLKHVGGRLEIASQPGKGTHMTLIAPIQPEEKEKV